jgi:hypothetical protein
MMGNYRRPFTPVHFVLGRSLLNLETNSCKFEVTLYLTTFGSWSRSQWPTLRWLAAIIVNASPRVGQFSPIHSCTSLLVDRLNECEPSKGTPVVSHTCTTSNFKSLRESDCARGALSDVFRLDHVLRGQSPPSSLTLKTGLFTVMKERPHEVLDTMIVVSENSTYESWFLQKEAKHRTWVSLRIRQIDRYQYP